MKLQHQRVVVVGGGPVGSIAALLLARAGIAVTVLEQHHGVILDYRASTFHPPTLDLLEPCGATDFLVRAGLIAPLQQIRDRKAGMIAEFDFGALKDDTRHPYRLQCEQFKLVDWAYTELKKFPQAEVLFDHHFTSIARNDDDEIVVRAMGPNHSRYEVAADLAIAADGGRSAFRKALHINFEGFTYPEHFLVSGTRFDFKAAMPDICSVNYTADPDEWYVLLQIPDMWRIIVPVNPDVPPTEAVEEASIQRALQNLLPRDQPYEIAVKAIYRVSQRVAEQYRLGRAFLAGDAAHINNPLGGVGLNGGLHDALSLTGRIIGLYGGTAADDVLEEYERTRKPEAIQAINAMTQRNKQLLEERDPGVRRRNLDEIAATAADPARAHAYMLRASMIESVRRCGLLAA